MSGVGPVVVDGDELLRVAAAVRSNMIHSDIIARQLTTMVASAAAGDLVGRAMAELRRLPCRTSSCEGCAVLAEFDRLLARRST